jgi:pimeloyl-ACP methyl ester carboxylesterase
MEAERGGYSLSQRSVGMPTVQTNDIETHYERHGSGPPLVFIHGALLDAHQWRPQVERLRDEYTVFTYDVRGHGRTGGSDRGVYSIELFADDLDAFLTALDIERPVLCGLSMGGCIAQVFASRHPDRVAGLVLADTFTATRLDWRDRLQAVQLRATILPARLFGFERVERAMVWLTERFADGSSGDYGNVKALRAERPPIPTREFVKIVRALVTFPRSTVDLGAITVPALVLYGEDETGFVIRHSAHLHAVLDESSLVELPDAGHASNMDAPTAFTDALRDFLETAVGSDTGGFAPSWTASS